MRACPRLVGELLPFEHRLGPNAYRAFPIRISISGEVAPLSPREREVAALISVGLTNREIASSLVISEATVKVHVRHILEKLRARSRAEVAARLLVRDTMQRLDVQAQHGQNGRRA